MFTMLSSHVRKITCQSKRMERDTTKEASKKMKVQGSFTSGTSLEEKIKFHDQQKVPQIGLVASRPFASNIALATLS